MTSKQITEAVGKPEQTVRNWVRALASKMDVIKSKLDASSPMHPAVYTLAESCQIIEEGLGKAAADTYRTNAANAKLAAPVATPKPATLLGALVRELRATMGAERATVFLFGLNGLPLPPAAPAPLQIPVRA